MKATKGGRHDTQLTLRALDAIDVYRRKQKVKQGEACLVNQRHLHLVSLVGSNSNAICAILAWNYPEVEIPRTF